MPLIRERVEEPLLRELFKVSVRPLREHAYKALENERVRQSALDVAQHMREIARAEDDRRELVGKKDRVNWRRFYVGGVGIGLTFTNADTRAPYAWFAFAAYNTKPSAKASKCCAEMRILRAAREVRCICIAGLVVVGENQPDGRSKKDRGTLDPCADCRDMMRHPDFRYLFARKTLILTSQPLSQVPRMETLEDMMKAHGETWP